MGTNDQCDFYGNLWGLLGLYKILVGFIQDFIGISTGFNGGSMAGKRIL